MTIHENSPLEKLHQRDYIAVMALQGLLANPSDSFTKTTIGKKDFADRTARLAYKYADAMIAAADKSSSDGDEAE